MLQRNLKISCLLLTLLAGCQHNEKVQPSRVHAFIGNAWRGSDRWFYPKAQIDFSESGIATVYDPGRGHVTADGDIYSPYAITGAHQTLQLPLIVKVVNLDNGRAARILLNDRGPANGRRTLAVTPAVAKLLGASGHDFPVRITSDVSANDASGFNSMAIPDLGLSSTQRGDVAIQSLDGRRSGTLVGDARIGQRVSAEIHVETLPAIYTQEALRPYHFAIVLGAFYSQNVAAILAHQCQATISFDPSDGSNPPWQVNYGPYDSIEEADSAQNQARLCGITNPRLMVR